MISEKMKGFVQNSSAIRAMFEEGKILAKEYGAENVYDFSLGNPSVEPPESVKRALIHILEEESPNYVHGYTNNSGYEDVRTYVANANNTEFGTTYKQDHVIMTNGAAGALNILFKTLLNPGDEVIAIAPFFGEYRAYVGNFDGKLAVVSADTENFQIQLGQLEAAITTKTKALIINSPNNPSGAIYSEKTLKDLSALLEQKAKEIGHPIYLVSDEPYRYLAYDGATVPFVPHFYRNTFVAYSFSKSLSLPGERIGYILVSPDMDGYEEIIFALNVANRICGFVNAPSLFQRVLPYCMKERTNIAVYEKNRNLLYNMLTEIGYECYKPAGAFYLFPKSLISDDIAFCNAGKEFRILSAPGASFACPGHFRLAYCVSEKTIENSYDSFKKLYDKFRGKNR